MPQRRLAAAWQPPTHRQATLHSLPRAPRLSRQPQQPTIAAAASLAASSSGSGGGLPADADADLRRSAVQLAIDTLRPDWLLLLVTTVSLAATIAFTLVFPLAIGEVFDVVRAQGGLSGGAAPAGMINPFGAGGAAAAPPSFRAAMIKLSSCLVLSATGNALVSYFSTLLGERFGHRLKGRLMQTILSKQHAFFDASTKGDLVSRLTLDVIVLQTTLADFIGQRGFRSMFEVVGALGFIALQQPLLALVSFAITPLLSRLLRAVVVKSSAIIYQRQQVAAQALEFAAERLSQVQTVQVFAQEQREAAAFSQLSQTGYDMARQYAMFQGVVEGAGRLAVNVGTVALLGFGGLLVIDGKITVGALLAVNVFNLFISVGLSSVAASLGELGKAVGALERVADLMVPAGGAESAGTSSINSSSTAGDAAAEFMSSSSSSGSRGASAAVAAQMTNADSNGGAPTASTSSSSNGGAPTASTSSSSGSNGSAPIASSSSSGSSSNGGHISVAPAIDDAAATPAAAAEAAGSSGRVEFRDVWFRYRGGQDWAVRGLNLTLLPGQTVALVGPSGGGKSTIASLMLGLYQPQRGSILINGQPLQLPEDGSSGAAAVGVAAVLQQPMLMSGSVTQQIRYGNPEAPFEEVLKAATAAFADEFVRDLPNGYDTEVGERGHALSGGQKQRLAIARALLVHPKILVLDEVTSALDVNSERYINNTLRSLAATKLIIAHRLTTVRRADMIAVVAEGRVTEQGSHEELLRLDGGAYQRLINTAELGSSGGSGGGGGSSYWVQSGVPDGNSSSDEDAGPAERAAASGQEAAADRAGAADAALTA